MRSFSVDIISVQSGLPGCVFGNDKNTNSQPIVDRVGEILAAAKRDILF